MSENRTRDLPKDGSVRIQRSNPVDNRLTVSASCEMTILSPGELGGRPVGRDGHNRNQRGKDGGSKTTINNCKHHPIISPKLNPENCARRTAYIKLAENPHESFSCKDQPSFRNLMEDGAVKVAGNRKGVHGETIIPGGSTSRLSINMIFLVLTASPENAVHQCPGDESKLHG
ncbi:hypothetical protein Pmar_PMAR011823 [Perkinsus marinus ATCC 50983]|uniref:Uncharacterized protein n=1 Tax=Perkinsus marinus (strain ATCC 50983 / TXsc) TaxID=423536 RepID=C5LBF5_PERM5|nr:hypothetical protein Pmar_PMAR011823 [Perkinsus marinus ATCC 50983]EER05776.1 hypothetical protein Pmar_PMAR011823 [Perkinsus marinus ATCC 50983]|eukprot:XP_002773960.1 hypothetical protein Pmar_PMAR011823 [Perkinsus marinus ATCC 50983]